MDREVKLVTVILIVAILVCVIAGVIMHSFKINKNNAIFIELINKEGYKIHHDQEGNKYLYKDDK